MPPAVQHDRKKPNMTLEAERLDPASAVLKWMLLAVAIIPSRCSLALRARTIGSRSSV